MTHLSLEECQKLKEVGYSDEESYWVFGARSVGNFPRPRSDLIRDNNKGPYLACPTLDELIEWLQGYALHFAFGELPQGWVVICPLGASSGHKTPLEAVYNLVITIKTPTNTTV